MEFRSFANRHLVPILEAYRRMAPLDGMKTFLGNVSSSFTFRKVDGKDVRRLLDEIDGYPGRNRRYRRVQFEKYLYSEKGIDRPSRSMFYGMFDADGGKCLALSYLNKVPDGFVCIAEIQSIFKGFGKPLLENISSMCGNMWLAADPTAKKTLVEYYRQFGLEERTYSRTKWSGGRRQTFFFKASDKGHRRRLLDYLGRARA